METKIKTLDEVSEFSSRGLTGEREINFQKKLLAERRAELLDAVDDFYSIGGIKGAINTLVDLFNDNLRACGKLAELQEKGVYDDEDEILPSLPELYNTFFPLGECIKMIAKMGEDHLHVESFEDRAGIMLRQLKG